MEHTKSDEYVATTVLKQIEELEAIAKSNSAELQEIKARVNIIGHNQKEFNRFIHLLNDVEYTMRNYRCVNSMGFWKRLKFLFTGKI